jgi:nucleotide-binding universal stress UspA family protein
MYHSILVCQDASGYARRAFELAVWLAAATQAQLHLIHLHSRKPHVGGRTSASEMTSIMQERVEEMAGEGIRGDCQVVEGWTSQALVDESKWHDLVVVGRQGESAHGRDIGSLPGLLLATSFVPVLIVDDTPTIPSRVLVAFDSTPDACMALRIATSLAAERNLDLRVVETRSGRRTKDHLAHAREYIAGWQGVEAEFEVLEGKASDRIVSYIQTHDIQLVFASALDRSMLGRKLTTRIIEETDASLIVPRGQPLPVH